VLSVVVLFTGLNGSVSASEVGDREKVLEEAKALLRKNNAQDAYDLLSRHEEDWAGGDAYDYLLGVAALDSKNSGEAIFSLQRLVVRRPAFSGARLELARAYYDAGDNELARIEFERLLDEDPPENVRKTVDSYMEAINTKARTYIASTQYYIDFGAGYDSNAPAATDDNQFLTFTLGSNNLEQSSAFGQVTLGALWNKPMSAKSQFMVSANIMHRSNPSAHFVDPSSATLGASWSRKSGAHMTNLGVTATASYLDRESNKQDYAVNGSYLYKMNDSWRFNSFVRYGALRFEDQLEIQDVDQLMVGLGLEQFSDNSLFNVTVLSTSDEVQETGSKFGNDGYGLQLSNTWYFDDGSRNFVNLSGSRTDYDEPFFGLEREDDIYSFTVGRSWAGFPSKDWTLTAQINYSEKDSSVDLYDYNRWEVGVFLRRIFN
jgi:tetratricopeptide (TPR) repeat protein